MEGDVGCDKEVADFEERLRSEEVVACTGVTVAKRSRLAANREKSTLATSLTSSFCISIKQRLPRTCEQTSSLGKTC